MLWGAVGIMIQVKARLMCLGFETAFAGTEMKPETVPTVGKKHTPSLYYRKELLI
jgi:hypothetical protein